MMYQIIVLFDGYSKQLENGKTEANCSCTLIKSPTINIIVDTMTAWDRDKIVTALRSHNIKPEDINYVICTHGHADHIGNNNLFTHARQHIVGHCIQRETIFDESQIGTKGEYQLNEDIKVIATPGHTAEDITLLIKNCRIINNDANDVDGSQALQTHCVAITGDLFEKEADIADPELWKAVGSKELQQTQAKNRLMIIKTADYIVPGHGALFKVTEDMIKLLESQL
ncbi:metallo-beta-lactamase domain-containing protein 1 [Microplitis mediator]|uniref:metallo-beta-lactamase domain-containing protein 1 n=1 Tax=Microplitis mediator TaxID=375433 RepID=UPI0025544107|nr:metallo-beta-lactamase domain-containing protein 1 [Microplitis mediator]